MYLSLHFCLISLLSIVPGTHAQFVTVCPATAKLSEDATMMFTFTPGVGVTPATVAAVTWFKSDGSGKQRDSLITNLGGNSQPNGRYSLNSNGYLIISNVTKEDTGYYLCQVFTSAGDSSRNNFSTLTVYYLETPTLEPSNTNVNETETAIFTCLFLDGLPMPITITWFKDGSVRDFSNTEKYPQSDATLQISNVNKMDGGDYQCRAENAAYSGDEGKLSNTGTLSVVFPLVTITTTIDAPTTTLTTKGTSTKSSQQPSTHVTIVTSTSSGDPNREKNNSSSPVVIIGVVIGLVVLVAVIVGGFSYKNDKLCFSRNATKASGGGSEKIVLSTNFSDIDTNTHAQVQKPKQVKAAESEHSEQAVLQTNPPDKPQRAPSRDRANVEQLTYADLDLVKSEAKVIRTDPETEYSSVRTEKQLTYADLDLTKDVNTGSKDKIIRTQPETEYSSVMITKK